MSPKLPADTLNATASPYCLHTVPASDAQKPPGLSFVMYWHLAAGYATKCCCVQKRPRIAVPGYPKLREALETYLSYRLRNRLGCALSSTEWRGLMPFTKLLLTHRGGGFELVKKRRKLPDGRQVEYRAADALEARFRELYRAAGIKTSKNRPALVCHARRPGHPSD